MNKERWTDEWKAYFKLVCLFSALEVAVVAGLAFLPGCASVDKDAVYEIYTNIVIRIPGSSAQGAKVDGASGSGSAGESASSSATDAKEDSGNGKSPEPTSPSVALNFKYGGFNGSKAIEDPNCQIKSLSMSSKGVTFKFSGGSWWGATHDNPTMRCCAFYKTDSGKWVGGFWEWGSPDRKYRAFTNIDDGYKGWNAKAFRAAKELAFVICSKDGKKRSNIVMTKGL